MPSRLVLQFLGIPQIHLDDKPAATDRRKAVALLAYLALNGIEHPQQKYSREALSALFWPEYTQAKAFANLRRTLWEAHQAIGESWLIAERDSLRLNMDAGIKLDVARFLDLLSQGSQQADPALRLPLLADSVKLYRGHFLAGFSLKDAYPFNEWAFAESEGLRRKFAEALTRLVESHCELKQADLAIPYARRLVTLDPLNETAHRQLMEVYLQAGQHGAALKQYQTCEQTLRKELNLDPQPETRLLYKRIRKGEIKPPVQVEKPTDTTAPRHNLPLHLSTFIGREKEQQDILRLLEKNRLVTLAGAGGIGKTRLSLQVGQRLLNDYPDGVWFITLDSLADPVLITQTVASVFNILEGPARPLMDVLMDVLRAKTLLLILDNSEHLLDACANLVKAVLQNCSNLKILVTSRETLNVPGEAVYYLPSLSIPEQEVQAHDSIEYESIRLFAERAILAQSSFTLTNENAGAVVEICRKVDGIPLAIELAAARVNVLQVEEILKQLQDSFVLLSSDGRSILPRHQTLQASMDWSWGLLNEAEQTFLRQLSAFAGGWTLESARAVCEGDVLGLTSALVKKSLIVVEQGTGRGTRYHFHEIVRAYAHEKLVESGTHDNICTRHLQYFLGVSEQFELLLRSTTRVDWLEHLNDERDNLRAALNWADKTDLETGLWLSGNLWRYWESSNLPEGIYWLENFLQHSRSNDFPAARAHVLHNYGWFLTWLQQFERARSATEESLALFRAIGNQPGEVDTLISLGNIKQFQDDPDGALEFLRQALELAKSLNDPWREANAYYFLGWDRSNFQRTLEYWEKASGLYRQVGDQITLANLVSALGQFLVLNGDLELGEKYLDEAMLLWQSNRSANIWENVRIAKSMIALLHGDHAQAGTLLQEALAAVKETGNKMGYLWVRVRQGYVALHARNFAEARDIFLETSRDFQKDGYTIGAVFALEGMASLYVETGKPQYAARLIGLADTIREKISDRRPLLEQVDVDKTIAACLIKMGEAAFSDAYDQGTRMTLAEAVALVMSKKWSAQRGGQGASTVALSEGPTELNASTP
jgi:predicted ATPase/DNA-binding SARP family transcriptional activator